MKFRVLLYGEFNKKNLNKKHNAIKKQKIFKTKQKILKKIYVWCWKNILTSIKLDIFLFLFFDYFYEILYS